MRTTLIGRWLEKNNKPFVALLAAGATLAIAMLVDASSSPQVEQVGQMAIHRSAHKATALSDGRVLITGGRNTAGIVIADAEIFDPNTDESSAVAPMATARVDHTATLLKDGRVLITGGSNATGTLNSAELFDPSTGTFSGVSGGMNMARARHTATLLSSGKVLIAGGDVTPTLVDPNGTDVTGTAEMFDPTAGTFGDLVLLQRSRSGHTATLFSNDTVWLAGGGNNTIESFDASAGAFTLSDTTMTAVRSGHEAFALSSISLLFFGGDTGHTIDEFNSSADMLSLKATMDGASSSATLLANGKILVLRPDAAGLYALDATDQATAFTVFDETSIPGSTALLRSGQTATELSGDKKILVAGGVNAQHQPMLQIAAFNPARIWTDKDDYYPDEPVLLFGSGWKSNEDVYLYAVDSETEQWTYGSTETADAQGSFSVEPYFIVQMRHLGTLFTVSAVGAQSNMQAEVEFTDAVNFNSITVGSQTGTAVAGVAGAVTYQLTANYTGSGANNDDPVTLSFVGWTGATPAGVTPSISPSSVTQGSPNSTLTLQTSSSTIVAGTYTFTVRGTTAGGQTKSNTGTLVVAPGAATKIALSGSTSNLGSGSTRALTATIQDANGNTVTSGPNSTLSVTFAKTAGTGTVTGLGSTNAVGGIATATVTGNQLGSVTIAASGGGLAAGTGNPITFTVVAGAANKLALSGSAADLTAGTTRVLTATIQDVNGNTVTTGADSSLSVTFAKTAGSGTVTGLGSATASAGVATLTVTGNAPGSITIAASANGSGGALAAGTGNPITFNVVAGAASKLALSGSTGNLTAGATRVLTATIQDTAGNTITTGPDSTLSVAFAKTAGSGNVSGLTSVTASGGVANITVTGTTAGSVTITASSGALAPGTGNPITFTVVASTTVDHFAFDPISSPQTAGTPFNVTITAQDAGNNTVIGYNGNGFKVKLTSTGALVGAPVTTPAFTNGVLTNQSVTITNTGTVITITATDSPATGMSNSFQVNAGAPAKLVFSQQPTATTAGQTITPAVTVQIQDANSNPTTSTAAVGIAILANPSSGTLSGTTPVAAVNGVATFSDLSINKGGTGYTLQATSTGLTSATSTAFTINNPAPTLASIAPTSGNISDAFDVVFNGTNYIQGVTTVSFGANITVTTVTVNSSIKLTAHISIGSGAAVGPRNVSVANPIPGGGTATLTNGFTVNNPATTTVVTSSSVNNTSTYGDSVTFTATVSTASGTPTGDVTFYAGSTCGGTVLAGPTTLDNNGKATFPTSSLNAPGQTITACYTPTGIFQPSNGSVTQTVNKATPNATLKVTNSPATYNASGHAATVDVDSSSVPGSVANILTGGAATQTNAGTFAVTANFVPSDTTNYNTLVDLSAGDFVIQKADQTITWADPAAIVYGTALSSTQLNATVAGVPSGSASGALTYMPGAGTLLDAGNGQDLKVDAAETTNYKPATKTVHINVEKADQTITWADPADIVYGTALSSTQLNATVAGVPSGSAPGALTYMPGAGTLLDAGNGQDLKVDAAETTNYKPATKTVHINVEKADQTITWADPADIVYGTALSSTQLNATVAGVPSGSAPGALTYMPGAGTLLDAGNGQDLKVDAAETTNYKPATKTVHINVEKLAVTLTGMRDYDGTPNAGSGILTVSNKVGTDIVTVASGTATLTSKNVGSQAITSVGTLALGGGSAGNYTLTGGTGSVTIKQLALTINAVTDSRPYNGYADSSAAPQFVTLVGTDTGSAVQVFDIKNAGARTLSVSSYTINDDNGGANYGPVTTNTANGSISTLALTINAVTDSKTYDGYKTSNKTPSFVALVGTDTGTATQVFDSKNAGSRTLSVSSYMITDGNGGANYGPVTENAASGSISTLALTINAVTDTKTFDNNTDSNKTPSFVTLVGTDTGTATQVFDSKNAGSRTLSVSTYTITDGNSGANYGPVTKNTAAGTVNPAQTSTGVTSSKNPSTLNESVTFTATVTNTQTSPIPMGTVTFTYTNAALNLSGTLGTATLDPSGKAMVSWAALPVNASVVKATYNNLDGNFVGGTTGQVTQNVSYIFVGFLQPIDNLPMTNSSKAGQTIPVKWQLKDAAGNLISDLNTFVSLTQGTVTCGSAPVDVIEELAAPGATVFRFDGTQFIYNWQTSKPWAGGCRTLQVKLSDGTSHYAQFTFK